MRRETHRARVGQKYAVAVRCAYMEGLEQQGRRVEAVFPTDSGDGLVDDFVAVITSMAARLYGRRNSKRRAERVKACIEHVMRNEADA